MEDKGCACWTHIGLGGQGGGVANVSLIVAAAISAASRMAVWGYSKSDSRPVRYLMAMHEKPIDLV